jgi:hypothetical protein
MLYELRIPIEMAGSHPSEVTLAAIGADGWTAAAGYMAGGCDAETSGLPTLLVMQLHLCWLEYLWLTWPQYTIKTMCISFII